MAVQQNQTNPGKILETGEYREENLSVTYILSESPAEEDTGTIYSVTVETRSVLGEDCVTAWDISRNRETAARIFQALTEGTVTSCTLYEVLEDLL